jgi:hypothetical protein
VDQRGRLRAKRNVFKVRDNGDEPQLEDWTMNWQPIETAPKKQGAEILAWFQKVKLDEDDNPTDEAIGGAMAQIERQGDGWTEPEWLSAHGAYYFEDWCFADQPVLWHALPAEPTAAELAGSTAASGVDLPDGSKPK